MRGVILCGGLGTRLYPLTITANKHLLPVYSKPMIFYPIETLIKAGIKELLIITSGPHAGDFLPVIKNGQDFGLKHVEYAFQDKPDGGIADALSLAKEFAKNDNITVILGDNTTDSDITASVKKFKTGAHIFIKKVENPSRYGVCKFEGKQSAENNTERKLIEIIEKPIEPPSNLVATGLYIFDNKVFEHIKQCKPSNRGQLEIADVLNIYIQNNKCTYSLLSGYWGDAGEPDSLFAASEYWYYKEKLKEKKN